MPLPKQAELPLRDLHAGPPGAVGRGGELRRILLGERVVHYTLRRGQRRTIGLTIDQRGLRVGAPPRAALGEIEALIHQHAAWVVDKLDAWRSRPELRELAVEEGTHLPVLGASVRLRLGQGANTCTWLPADGAGDFSGELLLAVRHGNSAGALLERALRERARAVFGERMGDFCSRFAIAPPPLSLTSARTRWGSCSRRSGIRLNWRLIHAPLPLIDYVLAHELAHLKEMNHTTRFWAEVGRLYPDWQAARRALKAFGENLPRFEK